MIDASILICTRNRAPALEKTLLSLSLMKITADIKYEVLVVDNGSTDNTGAVVSAWADRLPIQCLHEGRPGLSRARNRGLAASCGKYILFTDDDCIVSPDWLTTATDLLSKVPRQIVGGRVELYDPTDRPITIRLEDSPVSMLSVADLLGFIHGCNMIVGRCVVEEIGLFDIRLGAGTHCKAAEDTDFIYRAFRHGIPVQYRPELILAHNHGRKLPSEEQSLMDGYILSLGAIATKYAFRGDTSLLKLAYWSFHSEHRDRRRRRLKNYMLGAVRYGRSLFG